MNYTIYPAKHDPKVRSLKDVVNNYEHSYAPEEFQRPEAWGASDRKHYFKSLLMNRLEGNFVLVDIQLALSKLQKIAPEDRAYKFFNDLANQMIEYIILDGNNRFKFLTVLKNDEWQIPKGTYTYVVEDDVLTLVVGPHNNVFSKLPKLVQKTINERQLVISEYVQIDYTGLSDVFTNVNSGVPLNAQEKRNALDSPWSGYVRKIRKEISNLLIAIIGTNYKHRLKGDEWIVETIDFSLNVSPSTITSVGQSTKDKLYASDINVIDKEEYTERFLQLADFVTAMVADPEVDLEDKVITRPSAVMNLFWMMCNGIETYEQAVDAMILHEQFYKDSSIVNDDGNNYVWACGGLSAKCNELRMRVLSEIVEKITNKVLA